MTISRGQMPRQLYGLGSLVKSIGKAAKGVVKGVKDIAKSPIGKAALLYTAGFGIPGTNFGGLLGTSQASMFGARKGLFGTYGPVSALKNLGIMKSVGDGVEAATRTGPLASVFDKLTGSNLFKAAAIAVPSVLAAAGVEDEQEIAELQQDTGKLAALLERGYRNLNPGVSDEEVDAFVRANVAEGGRISYAMGNPEKNAIQASGIMGLPLNENPAGITELDLRETGGFIPPVGVKEKADDIPAMLSNNEFVFTADAVRGMGGGDVDKGAERMYAMMKTLENGGRV